MMEHAAASMISSDSFSRIPSQPPPPPAPLRAVDIQNHHSTMMNDFAQTANFNSNSNFGAAAAPSVAQQQQQPKAPPPSASAVASLRKYVRRDTINGEWILDKTIGDWSMSKYLEVMQVDPVAIEAHEKGERECETVHTIELNLQRRTVKITKRSRVNNDLVVELNLDQERVEYLKPHDRPKHMMASANPQGTRLEIRSSLQTVNGKASVMDVKVLVQQQEQQQQQPLQGATAAAAASGGGGGGGGVTRSIMVQTLTIVNEQTKQSHTTIRHFRPNPEIID